MQIATIYLFLNTSAKLQKDTEIRFTNPEIKLINEEAVIMNNHKHLINNTDRVRFSLNNAELRDRFSTRYIKDTTCAAAKTN